MLQINSGKLYPNGVLRTNELRGVLYSNLFLMRMDDSPIVTRAGRLLQAEATNLPRPIIYEVTEQFDDEIMQGTLASHGVQPYLQDFAAVNILHAGPLAALAADFDPEVAIDWCVLLPQASSAPVPEDTPEAGVEDPSGGSDPCTPNEVD
jgi:hypothetical protein